MGASSSETSAKGLFGCWNNNCMVITVSVKESGAVPPGGGGLPRIALVLPSYMTWVWRFRDEVKHQGWPVHPCKGSGVWSPAPYCGGLPSFPGELRGSGVRFCRSISVIPCQYYYSNNPNSCEFENFRRGVFVISRPSVMLRNMPEGCRSCC
jgi:hypothetical protein